MQYFITICLILLQISDLTWVSAEKSEPYCYRNVTDVIEHTVTKTRQVNVKKRGFMNNILSKKETKIEPYEVTEQSYKIRLEQYCCDGFKMSELKRCEPQCVQNGCPKHSKCVDPEVCECKPGYFSARSQHDDKNYCKPICENKCPEHSDCVGPNECACMKGYRNVDGMLCVPHCASGCPHNGKCISPNLCECLEGYKSEHGSCLPLCILGDMCQNGRCVDKNKCVCNSGYIFNEETKICEASTAKLQESDFDDTTLMNSQEITETTEDQPEIETDIDTDNDDIDPNEVFDEIFDSTTYGSTEDYTPLTHNSKKCPEDFVFHQGECKPLKFASAEIDCRFKPCHDPQATCMDNGTCSCNEGFKWFRSFDKTELNNTVKAVCLSLSEYEAKLGQLPDNNPQKIEISEPFSRSVIFFIVVGVLILVTALISLILWLVCSRRGELDVEAKNLSCVYDHKAKAEAEKSVI